MSDPLTAAELDELERLEREATPGPWRVEYDPTCAGDLPTLLMPAEAEMYEKFIAHFDCGEDGDSAKPGDGVRDCTVKEATANAAFCNALRNAAPRLLAAARRELAQAARLAEAERLLEECCEKLVNWPHQLLDDVRQAERMMNEIGSFLAREEQA